MSIDPKKEIILLKKQIKNTESLLDHFNSQINEYRKNINKHILTGNVHRTLIYQQTLNDLRRRGYDETHYLVNENSILDKYQNLIRETFEEKNEIEKLLVTLNENYKILQSQFRPTKSAASKFSTREVSDNAATTLQKALVRKQKTMKKGTKSRSGTSKGGSKKRKGRKRKY